MGMVHVSDYIYLIYKLHGIASFKHIKVHISCGSIANLCVMKVMYTIPHCKPICQKKHFITGFFACVNYITFYSHFYMSLHSLVFIWGQHREGLYIRVSIYFQRRVQVGILCTKCECDVLSVNNETVGMGFCVQKGWGWIFCKKSGNENVIKTWKWELGTPYSPPQCIIITLWVSDMIMLYLLSWCLDDVDRCPIISLTTLDTSASQPKWWGESHLQ